MTTLVRRSLSVLVPLVLAGTLLVVSGRTGGQATGASMRWLAAGDSYSSGQGDADAAGSCAQSNGAYAKVAANLLQHDSDWSISQEFTACTGAVTGQFYNGADSQWSQAQALSHSSNPRFNVITLSFGGDDVGFRSILEDCYTARAGWALSQADAWTAPIGDLLGHCPTSESTLEGRIDSLIRGNTSDKRHLQFGPNNQHLTLAQFYAQVANNDVSSGGDLIVVGYPALFAPVSQWPLWLGGQCYFMDPKDVGELNAAAAYLDQHMAAAVTQAQAMTSRHIEYISLENLYQQGSPGHSLCSGGTQWLNGPSRHFTHSFHPDEAGNFATGEYVASQLSNRYPTSTTSTTSTSTTSTSTTTTTTTETTEPATAPDAATYNIGDSFNSECVVAWPTAPTVTSQDIQMTMSCDGVPSEYLFTHVIYGDPHLNVTPDTGQMQVIGKITDVATSDYGYKELVVQASRIVFSSNGEPPGSTR